MSLWDDVGAVYERAGVKTACLALQDDYGQCVSYLLWAAWTADKARFPADATLIEAAALARRYEDQTLGPRRRQYAALKAGGAGERDMKAAWDAMLESEQRLLAALEALTPVSGPPRTPSEALIEAARAWGGPTPPMNLLTALADAFSRH